MSAEEQEGHWLINELLGGHKRAFWNMLGTGDAQAIYIFHPYLLPPVFLLWWCSPLCPTFLPASFQISWHEGWFLCLKTWQSHWWSIWNTSSSFTPGSGSTSLILPSPGKARAAAAEPSLLCSCGQHGGWDEEENIHWYSLLLSPIRLRDIRGNAVLSPGTAGNRISWGNLTFSLKYWHYCISTYQQNASWISFIASPEWVLLSTSHSHPAQVHTVPFHSSHIPLPPRKVSSGSLPAPSRFNWNALKANLVVCRRWAVLSVSLPGKNKWHRLIKDTPCRAGCSTTFNVTVRQETHSDSWG